MHAGAKKTDFDGQDTSRGLSAMSKLNKVRVDDTS